MMQDQFSQEQILALLHQAEGGRRPIFRKEVP